MKKNTKTRIDPEDVAFRCAQQRAARSAAVRLMAAPLEVGHDDVIAGLDATFEVLLRAYLANGVTHDDELEHTARVEAGYFYGLAVGVALGHGGKR